MVGTRSVLYHDLQTILQLLSPQFPEVVSSGVVALLSFLALISRDDKPLDCWFFPHLVDCDMGIYTHTTSNYGQQRQEYELYWTPYCIRRYTNTDQMLRKNGVKGEACILSLR